MTRYEDILNAKDILKLPDQATMAEIKKQYRCLIRQWHPDTCLENSARCDEMTKKIVDSYRLISVYCSQYKYSFAKEDVEKYLTDEEWWLEMFGSDPLWGSKKCNR